MTSMASIAPLAALAAHESPVNHIAFSGDGRMMASADTSMKVRVWQDRELIREYDLLTVLDKTQKTERIRGVQLTLSGDRLFIAAGEYLTSFNLSSDSEEPDWIYTAPRMLVFFQVPPISIALSAQDNLAASFDNGSLAVWNSNGTRRGLIRHNLSPRFVTFLPDETLIGTEGFTITRWSLDSRQPVSVIRSDERIYGMAASSDGKYIAARHLYNTAVHDIETGEEVVRHKQGRGLPLLAFEPRAHTLAIGTQHMIHLYDVPHSNHLQLSLDDAELISLAFLPDGSQLLAGCSDGQIRAWENPLHELPQPGTR